MIPQWFEILAWASLLTGVLCAGWIALDCWRNPPHMRVMTVVWPLCGLFGGPVLLWFFRRYGRSHGDDGPPFAVSVAKGTLHCGAGCTLGDIVAESLVIAAPAILAVFGYGWLFGDKIFAAWVHDYVWAFGFGIVLQYFAIAPMRNLGFKDGLQAAVKADFASLSAWQVGMYGLMAVAHFWLFPVVFGVSLEATRPEFWFVMQLAMMAGFVTAFPVNWWLIASGVKERM